MSHFSRKRFLFLFVVLLSACSAAPQPTATSLPTPTSAPTAISPSLIEQAAEFCPAPRNWQLYVTQPGDTLHSLARRTSSSVEMLASANCLNNPRALPSGQVFYLPRRPIN